MSVKENVIIQSQGMVDCRVKATRRKGVAVTHLKNVTVRAKKNRNVRKHVAI